MTIPRFALAMTFCGALLAAGCTGGTEGSAAEEERPRKNPIAQEQAQAAPPPLNARAELREINPAIPVYAGARYREDLTRRDAVMIRNQYGPRAQVYTLATNDSYPQVYHYYTTYLAQFRAFPAHQPYPPEQQNWRTLEVKLNDAMQDPFIPGDTIGLAGRQVTLQIAETEAEPKTVIRYIVTPAPPPVQQVAGATTGVPQVAAPAADKQSTQRPASAVR